MFDRAGTPASSAAAIPNAVFQVGLSFSRAYLHFPPEIEAKLTHTAAQQGRTPDEFAQEIIARYIEEETRSLRLSIAGRTRCSGAST